MIASSTNPVVTSVTSNTNHEAFPSDMGPRFKLGELKLNSATFSRYRDDLLSRSTALLSTKDERWSTALACASNSDTTLPEQKEMITNLIRYNFNAFHRPGDKLSATWVTEHAIPLMDESKSVFIRTRDTGHTETGTVTDLTQKQVHAGVVEPCLSHFR